MGKMIMPNYTTTEMNNVPQPIARRHEGKGYR